MTTRKLYLSSELEKIVESVSNESYLLKDEMKKLCRPNPDCGMFIDHADLLSLEKSNADYLSGWNESDYDFDASAEHTISCTSKGFSLVLSRNDLMPELDSEDDLFIEKMEYLENGIYKNSSQVNDPDIILNMIKIPCKEYAKKTYWNDRIEYCGFAGTCEKRQFFGTSPYDDWGFPEHQPCKINRDSCTDF